MKVIINSYLPYKCHYNPLLIWNSSGSFFEELPCLLHKLSLILTDLDYKLQWNNWIKNIEAVAYNGPHTAHTRAARSGKSNKTRILLRFCTLECGGSSSGMLVMWPPLWQSCLPKIYHGCAAYKKTCLQK